MHRRSQLFVAVLFAVFSSHAALGQTTKPGKVEPVDYRKLKELMPERVAGLKRTSNEGERVAFGELTVANARADYSKDSDEADAPNVNIEIVDYGANPQMAEALAMWSQQELDRAGDDGYERTRKIAGFPALEKYTNEGKSGELTAFVAGRYIVTIRTTNLDSDELVKIGEKLDLKKLAALK